MFGFLKRNKEKKCGDLVKKRKKLARDLDIFGKGRTIVSVKGGIVEEYRKGLGCSEITEEYENGDLKIKYIHNSGTTKKLMVYWEGEEVFRYRNRSGSYLHNNSVKRFKPDGKWVAALKKEHIEAVKKKREKRKKRKKKELKNKWGIEAGEDCEIDLGDCCV